ncbi:alpha-ketoglutarate-dependent dioxygenase AlkB family protein [Shinella oryzae]|uniref:Alpha-ketoglutarate-dependent dioxygenase AlkB n=1 Tax=Shinella oryzae TaxID=2871820 RepID=A0ABY9K5G7_9HYPH|nr:alpha-ketoglutarate-dependent dioxygenase AlkB [Shinella oryzae]WLS03822.1 alpha-ketoglutarate-dependent dioxygenase AlkB [Shinella oryzae]
MTATGHDLAPGLRYFPDYFDRAAQEALVAAIRAVVADAPLYVPRMPKTGKAMSVRMTNCGALGWVTDKDNGYRYQPTHPETGRPWPAIPQTLLALWEAVSGFAKPPEACLVNFYDPEAKMGLHQDRDEADLAAPVVSVSLGDQCLFRVGGTSRSDPTRSFRLSSGDVFMFGGESRLIFHGVDRIYPGTSTLLRNPGRINLTLRRVNP